MAGDTYNVQLCKEKHDDDRRRISCCEDEYSKLHGRVDTVITAVNGKFTKLYYFFLATLISSLGGTLSILIALVVMLSKLPKTGQTP